jgi:low temperature requirement protein LtrA
VSSHGALAKPERRASWLKLFFDLCFVVAVGAVAHTLHDRPTIPGIVLFAALFIPVWWSWMEYAWYTTSFPEAGEFNRFGAFAAMLTVLAMATQVETASHDDPKEIILTFVTFHAIVVALFLRADRLYPGLHGFLHPLRSGIRAGSGDRRAAGRWTGSLPRPRHLAT